MDTQSLISSDLKKGSDICPSSKTFPDSVIPRGSRIGHPTSRVELESERDEIVGETVKGRE